MKKFWELYKKTPLKFRKWFAPLYKKAKNEGAIWIGEVSTRRMVEEHLWNFENIQKEDILSFAFHANSRDFWVTYDRGPDSYGGWGNTISENACGETAISDSKQVLYTCLDIFYTVQTERKKRF